MTITTIGGSDLHGLMCEAFLGASRGFVPIAGELYEILTMRADPFRRGAFVWTTRRVAYAGAA